MADLFHAMRQARKAGDGGGDDPQILDERLGGGKSQRGILPIVHPAQMRCLAQFHDFGGTAILGIIQHAIHDKDAAPQHFANRDRPGGDALARQLGENRRAIAVIHADNGLTVLGHLMEKPLLDGGIILHAAVTVDMVGREVRQQRDIGFEAGRQVNLEAGHFQHIKTARARRRQFQHRVADIAADLGIKSGMGQDMADQRRGGGFAVCAGDGDHRGAARLCGIGADFAGEQFDIADHFDLGGPGMGDHFMGLGMRQRHAGA